MKKKKSQKRVDVENKFTLIGKYRAQSFTVNLRVRKTNCGIVEVTKTNQNKNIYGLAKKCVFKILRIRFRFK